MRTATLPCIFSFVIPDEVADEDVATYLMGLDYTEDGSYEFADFDNLTVEDA